MWGREMRAGLLFVISALLIGQGFREWRRSHRESFREIVGELESRDSRDRAASASAAGLISSAADSGRAQAPASARGTLPRASGEAPVGRIDPNRASASELTRLPGIGPALAGRIVADRGRRGAFASPDALLRVRGIGPKTLDRIRGYLSFPAAAHGDSLTGF